MNSLNKIMKLSQLIDEDFYLSNLKKIEQWFSNIPENEEKMINDYLSLHGDDGIFVKKLREATCMYIGYEHHKYATYKHFIYDYNFDEVMKSYDKVFGVFQTYSDFLNPIVESDPHSLITSEVSLWLVAYMNFKESSKFKNPSQIIQKDIHTIKKCVSTLAERLEGYFLFSINEEYHDDKFFHLDDMFKTLNELREDLESKRFNLIHRNNYYPTKPTTKAVLQEILEDYTKKHNINKCIFYIKELKDAL